MKRQFIWILALLFATPTVFAQNAELQTSEIIVRSYLQTKIMPDSIYNMRIVAGKKFEVISLTSKDVDLSTNNYRQAFRKTPGIFVSEHDASGLQTSISTRGLSANRSWEFNMRQNGYDVAADPSGYAEAYYSPTLDAVASLHVYRGSSVLQYGSQFGGMINYQLKDNIGERPIVYEGSHTAGSFGMFNSYNAIGGKKERGATMDLCIIGKRKDFEVTAVILPTRISQNWVTSGKVVRSRQNTRTVTL